MARLVITYTHGQYDTYAEKVEGFEYPSIELLREQIEARLPLVKQYYRSSWSERSNFKPDQFLIEYRGYVFDTRQLLFECESPDYTIETLVQWFKGWKPPKQKVKK